MVTPRGCFRAIVQPIEVGGLRQKGFWVSGGLRVVDSVEGILVDQGLYPDEAHAMVETWRDSWFEEGSRLIHVAPRGFIDKVLPLTISPALGQITRVFVGRLEIVTPATARAVETAVASNDEVTLNRYGRFLEPIPRTVREEHSASTR